jgi:7-keto-8-aminopelargonate synthetase-like enzyme
LERGCRRPLPVKVRKWLSFRSQAFAFSTSSRPNRLVEQHQALMLVEAVPATREEAQLEEDLEKEYNPWPLSPLESW